MSFKVRCICNKKESANGHDFPELEIGSVYTVLDTIGERDLIGYRLAEVAPVGRWTYFDSKCFSKLDGPDERERLEAWKESTVKADAIFAVLADTADEPMPQDAFDRVWKGIESKLNRAL